MVEPSIVEPDGIFAQPLNLIELEYLRKCAIKIQHIRATRRNAKPCQEV